MILSDVSQRRILVNSIEMLNHVMNNGERYGFLLCEYHQIKEKLWLVTLTNKDVGDYRRKRMQEELVGIARLDINELEGLEIKYE